MNTHQARVILSIACEPGDERVGALICEHGPITAVDLLAEGEITGGIQERVQKALRDNSYSTLMRKLEQIGGQFLTPEDCQWPSALHDLDDLTPFGLWSRGSADLAALCQRAVGVVGARASTSYGERIASQIGELAGINEVTVISGAAYGIDAAAHRGVLAASGQTIAVLACGVDIAYPSAHEGLLNRIAQSGLIVSEVPPGQKPYKRRFLIRNRLIAALSSSVVVVEAALRSGSLSTAHWAADLGRNLWGIPGPITSATSAGVHAMIAQGHMRLATQPDDVVESLGCVV